MKNIFLKAAAKKIALVTYLSGAVLLPCIIAACNTATQPQPTRLPDAPLPLSPADSAVAVAITPTLTWAASSGATGYTVQLSPSSAFDSAVIADLAATQTAYTISGYLANTAAYYWRVRAKNNAGAGAWSAVRSFTTDKERVVLLAPNGGEVYHVGDTVKLSFEYRNRADTSYFVTLWFSLDGGKSFDKPVLGARNTVRWDGPPRKDTVWTIPPDTALFGSYVTNQAVVRVEDYTKKTTENDVCDMPFTILSR